MDRQPEEQATNPVTQGCACARKAGAEWRQRAREKRVRASCAGQWLCSHSLLRTGGLTLDRSSLSGQTGAVSLCHNQALSIPHPLVRVLALTARAHPIPALRERRAPLTSGSAPFHHGPPSKAARIDANHNGNPRRPESSSFSSNHPFRAH